MSPLVETARLRRLRPLLSIPSARLRATLRVEGLGWVDNRLYTTWPRPQTLSHCRRNDASCGTGMGG